MIFQKARVFRGFLFCYCFSALTVIFQDRYRKLYGRKGSEGVTSETVDGYSVTYQEWDNLFKPYMAILNKDFGLDGSQRERGKVFFL